MLSPVVIGLLSVAGDGGSVRCAGSVAWRLTEAVLAAARRAGGAPAFALLACALAFLGGTFMR
ncbi:MAG: hypothetical protein JWL67_71 [Solirubrobacterales bacterium]|nr:hypothetical protein [Solirubrobacterales bacterium]